MAIWAASTTSRPASSWRRSCALRRSSGVTPTSPTSTSSWEIIVGPESGAGAPARPPNDSGWPTATRWFRVHEIDDQFRRGQWDDALQDAEAFIAEAEASAHYLVTGCLRVRASVKLGRGNHIGALADAAAALEFARGAKNPANLLVVLPFLARSLYETGRTDRADAAITETLHAAAGNENILEPIDTAIAMVGVGRHTDYLDVAARATLPSRRWEIGRTIVLDDLAKAADMSARDDQRTTEAYLRLIAAERLAAKGRRRDAQHQVHRALAFHRMVGAVAYVNRGEELLAAMS